MSLVLELSPELESELAARAARLQLPLAEYAVRVLSRDGVQEDPAVQSVSERLDELRKLKDGWLEGRGKAPSLAGLDWLAATFQRRFPNNLAVPYLYPTPDGGVQAEWAIAPHDISLEIDLANHRGNWHCLNLKDDAAEVRDLDLNSDNDWTWVAGQLRKLAGGGV